ncbi:hypothetical protein UFOVP679_39 [uncultured Caudovirales phage]|uniref:Uncharacterized protein n=1 Tax=uncultured Caudovirales phage TaxID=2100421 RepID=A0A6J5NEU2_9CAUD|nr:hypothetical protein UFOVP679_39 [uncultured Caudovirales phage]
MIEDREAPKPDDMTPEQAQALADLKAGKFQRCCSPGEWRVFWQDGKAVFEDLSRRPLDTTPIT